MDVQVQRLGWGEIHNILYIKKNKNLNPQKPRLQPSETKSQPSQTKPPTQHLENKPPTLRIQAPTYRNTRLQHSETKLQPSKSKLAPTLRNLKQQSSEPKSDFFFSGGSTLCVIGKECDKQQYTYFYLNPNTPSCIA